MPVVVLYKDKSISIAVADNISLELANITKDVLDAKIEVRVLEPISSYNANPIHLEMRFRDSGEWQTDQLKNYHRAVMKGVGDVLQKQNIAAAYSFYIIPSVPARSIWAQEKSG